MDILYLLIPASALLVLAVLGVFAWALHGGQFDDLEREGARIVVDTAPDLDAHQAGSLPGAEESAPTTPPTTSPTTPPTTPRMRERTR